MTDHNIDPTDESTAGHIDGEQINAPLDLTPRQSGDVARVGGRKRVLPAIALALTVAFLGFVVVRTLNGSALFFYNADEAVEQRVELEGQRFRVQGTPFGDARTLEIVREGRNELVVAFPIAFDEQVIDVIHTGNPAELFQPGVPVVLEGTWVTGLPSEVGAISGGADDGWHFASTDMVVKHDNEYRNDNRDRLDDADRGGSVREP